MNFYYQNDLFDTQLDLTHKKHFQTTKNKFYIIKYQMSYTQFEIHC